MNNIIYCIENKINGKKYIGQTTYGLHKRYKAHVSESKLRPSGRALYRAFDKYGIENFEFYEIFCCFDNNLDELEIEFIQIFNTFIKNGSGYNMTIGGSSVKGYTHTNETKSKMSLAHKGKKISNETIEKIRLVHIGRKRSEDTKRKMREAKINKSNGHEGIGSRYRVWSENFNMSTNALFSWCRDNSLSDTGIKLNYNCLRAVALGKRNHNRGFSCEVLT